MYSRTRTYMSSIEQNRPAQVSPQLGAIAGLDATSPALVSCTHKYFQQSICQEMNYSFQGLYLNGEPLAFNNFWKSLPKIRFAGIPAPCPPLIPCGRFQRFLSSPLPTSIPGSPIQTEGACHGAVSHRKTYLRPASPLELSWVFVTVSLGA